MPGPLTWSGCGCVNHNYIESCRWKGILPLAALYVDTRGKRSEVRREPACRRIFDLGTRSERSEDVGARSAEQFGIGNRRNGGKRT